MSDVIYNLPTQTPLGTGIRLHFLNKLRVVQLSVDHNLNNIDEVTRLTQLGLDIGNLKFAQLDYTRCFGSYIGKGGYKECDYLSQATEEPISAHPEVVGGFEIDDSFRFLLLMSSGMNKTLNELYDSDTNLVNKNTVHMTVEQFKNQSTISGVAQSVVNKVVQYHHDLYMQKMEDMVVEDANAFRARDDVTLLVRNFNFPMPNAIQKKLGSESSYNSYVDTESNGTATNASQYSTNSSIGSNRLLFTRSTEKYRKDEKVLPYVDFTDYYKRVAEARSKGILPNNIEFD